MDMAMANTDKQRSSSKLVRTNVELEATRKEFIDWVDHILTQKKMTPTDLARDSGLTPSTLLRILNSKSHPFNITFATMRKVSEGSGYPIPRVLMEAHDVKAVEGSPEVKPRARQQQAMSPASLKSTDAASHRGIPLRYVSSLPSTLSKQTVDGVETCPIQMIGDQTAFAFIMPDDALAPAVRGGMTMYATKRRDPVAGDIVLLIDEAGRAKVRILTSIDEAGFTVEKSCDPKTETITFDDVKDFGVVEGMWRR